jgi:hypothetical protein
MNIKNLQEPLKISLYCFIFSLIFIFHSSAQSIDPESVNSGGEVMYQSNGSVSFVVGEIAILVMSDSLGNTLGGGFINAAIITTTVLSSENFFPEKIRISVYPNPTRDFININIEDEQIDFIHVRLVKSNGQVVFTGDYSTISKSFIINMASYKLGLYHLEIYSKSGAFLGLHKIIRQ